MSMGQGLYFPKWNDGNDTARELAFPPADTLPVVDASALP
jgi:hypothetical protein